MSRFYTSPGSLGADSVEIVGDDFKHLSRVLRLKPGDRVDLRDGAGMEADGLIADIEKDKAVVHVSNARPASGENRTVRATLFQAVPKQSKLEGIVQKNTELGVTEIVPFYAKRSVPKPTKSDSKKTERLNKVAYEACKQSGRGVVPTVSAYQSFRQALALLSGYDYIIVPYELENTLSLKKALKTISSDIKEEPFSLALVIGPEGGFDESEISALKELGARTVSLGERILRTETAGMSTLSQVNYEFEQ